MYNGHCIISCRLFCFVKDSLRSKYLHMYIYQVEIYKARRDQPHTDVSKSSL